MLEEFSGWFVGKSSPVHLFWHSFDVEALESAWCPTAEELQQLRSSV